MSIEIRTYQPLEIDAEEWRDLQELQRQASMNVIDRPPEEIDYLVKWDDFSSFYESHIDPNQAVGKRYRDNQSYKHPVVAIATESKELLGWAYTANNVSWSIRNKLHLPKNLLGIDLQFIDRKEEAYKYQNVDKKYFWLREFAVKPDYQNQGIAKQLGRILLTQAQPDQPVTAYVWPDEIHFLPEVLLELGFKYTDSTNPRKVKLFGEDKPTTDQFRMQAPSVSSVLEKLI